MGVIDNKLVPGTGSAEYEKQSTLLDSCSEQFSTSQKSITKFSRAMFQSSLTGSKRNYYEHQTIKSESIFECSVAVDESIAPVTEPLSSVKGTQMLFKVKFLLGY